MIKSFEEIIATIKNATKMRLVVAAAQDEYVLQAVAKAYQEGIVDVILVGDKNEIVSLGHRFGMSVEQFPIIDVKGNLEQQCAKAVDMVIQGEAQSIMKGLVDTSILLKAILNRKNVLLEGQLMNHVAAFEIPTYHKLLLMTDSGMIILPTLEQKKQMIENALALTNALRIEQPKIGIICAKEKVDPKMATTVDAEALVRLSCQSPNPKYIISGPIAIDIAINKEAARHKGVNDLVAGDADLIVMPNIESGNIFYKTLMKFGGAKGAGVIVGAKVPIILTSRSDSANTKFNSIALGALMAIDRNKEEE